MHQILDREAVENSERLMALGYGEVRDLALRSIEARSDELSPASQDKLDSLVRTRTLSTDGRLISRRVAATGTRTYATAFHKSLTSRTPPWSPQEVSAVQTFREVQQAEMRAASEGTGYAGGYGVPFYVDSSLIVTTLDQAEIGNVAKIETITTDAWHGVSPPGVVSGFTAENTAVADGTPTLAQPTIPVYADKFWVPASLELTQDYPNWLGEITTLFMNQWASDVSEYCSVGTGTGQPTGLFTRMSTTTANPAHVTVKTSGSLGAVDLRAAWSALPERYHLNASWLARSSLSAELVTL